MNIAIFGLGYVGCISLGCLAQNGHQITGVDVNSLKIDLINQGKPTVVEKDIEGIIQENKNKIKAADDYNSAVRETETAIVCVGTPSTDVGHLNLEYIKKVAHQIGESIKDIQRFYTILIRSTVPPGTNREVAEIIAQESGKTKNVDFAVVSNPEFLREGSAVFDYYNPPYTVLGSDSQKGIEVGKELYSNLPAPIYETEVKEAEILKYINNSFHALKITFANEVGNICKQLGIDSHRVMEMFSQDTKLNISPAYLKPGFAYGGSCLPKDLKALNTFAHDFYLNTPVINAIDKSNEYQINTALNMVYNSHSSKIGILGLSFKPGTDDLRHSPVVEMVEQLLGKGFELTIYDSNVELSRLTGGNKSFIEQKLPHLGRLLEKDLSKVVDQSETIIIANKEKEFETLNIPGNTQIIDLARIDSLQTHTNYKGIAW